jgi:hypothetical protein
MYFKTVILTMSCNLSSTSISTQKKFAPAAQPNYSAHRSVILAMYVPAVMTAAAMA